MASIVHITESLSGTVLVSVFDLGGAQAAKANIAKAAEAAAIARCIMLPPVRDLFACHAI